jgi:ParB-like chromosome segregation protein Spo0J
MAKKFLKRYEHLERVGKAVKEDEYTIKNNIKVLPEIEAFIPALSEEEYRQLELNIKEDGCRTPLVLWRNGAEYVMVDGHNRYRICQALNKDFKIEVRDDFNDLDDVKEWMLANQFGRRNLTKIQIAKIRGMHYNQMKQKLGGYDNIEKGKESKVQNAPSIEDVANTAEKVGKLHKVNPSTIKRDAMIATGLEKLSLHNPQLEREILAGTVKVNKSHLQELSKLEDIPALKGADDIPRLLKSATQKPTKKAPVAKKTPPETTLDKQKLRETKQKIIALLEQVGEGGNKKTLLSSIKKELKFLEKLV